MTRRDKRVSRGVGLVIAEIMPYVGAGIASAIEYNVLETREGVQLGAPTLWIQLWGCGAVALVATGCSPLSG